MPLVVPCPNCAARLSAPESAAGKQIRCPKCGAVAAVPAPEPVVEAKVTAPKPRPKPVQAEVAEERPRKASRRDEEEDEEDERPRKKKKPRYADDDDDYEHDRKRKPKRKSGDGVLAAAVVMGCLVLLAGIVGVVYLLSGKGSPLAKKAPVPDGWEEHKYPQDGFKLYAPKGASYTSVVGNVFQPNGRFGGGGQWFGNEFGNLQIERAASLTSTDWNAAQVMVHVVRFRDRVPSSVHGAMRRYPTAQFGGMEVRTIKWLGYDAVEQTHTNSAMRIVYTDRHAVIATISGPNMGRAKPEEEAAFFDNFEITN